MWFFKQKWLVVYGSIFCMGVQLSAYSANAAHPDVRQVSIEGAEYSCRPQQAEVYCPNLVYDVPLNVLARLDQVNCLDALSNPSREDLSNCFIADRVRQFFSKIQVMDVSLSCIQKNIAHCREYSNNCSPGPCGKLAEYLKDIENRGWGSRFTKEDGEAACDSLVF